ncbi:DUF5106 domain-containing protein [Candidatus Symbiothrix dinenymphae]|uniref:DUF5106 domain-containing protein n=1 Tax=Candidatus Symbiothrix dinenymphae TaxID=467085 RepID=UPI0006C57DE9|nr:DUF5106 domain-containing protein [Candidatus Symbiothrix dinenymphae]GAP71984.1 hypothetical protein SAMD00024442_21_29 [Candidatus Symbiothrix dinenymphae]
MLKKQTWLISLILLTGCTNKSNTQNVSNPQRAFVLPAIPELLTEPRDRADYLVTHYWDNFDFSDTTCVHRPEITEQAFVDFIDVLPHAHRQATVLSIQYLMYKAEEEPTGTMLRYFLTTAKTYLHDPNSPMHNDELYIPVAQYILASRSPLLTIAEKEPAKYHLEMMLKNRVGEQATDFSYTLPSGQSGRLHRIASEYTLLLFYNPDCHACAEVISALESSDVLNNLQRNGRLKVLALYPDKDLEIWKQKLSDMPKNWIIAHDKNTTIENKHLYDLQAIPTIYLLSKNKTVILKDATAKQLIQFITQNS